MTSANVFQIQSVLIFSLLCFGFMKRKDRSRHVPIMAAVIVWDLLLVLQIELNRGAVLKASEALTNPMMLNIHVALAVTCVVLYLALAFSGRKLLKNIFELRGMHRNIGVSVLILRLLTLITSFFAVTPK